MKFWDRVEPLWPYVQRGQQEQQGQQTPDELKLLLREAVRELRLHTTEHDTSMIDLICRIDEALRRLTMGTNIVSKKLSKVFYHLTRARQNAQRYADKMRNKGYEVIVAPDMGVEPPIYRVDVLRKK
jgi:hypothetical protein